MLSDKSDTSSDESSVSSDESDLSWDDDSSSEESLLEEEDEEEYDPRGAEGDDDANECCHWSTSKEVPADQIQIEAGIPVYGGCLSEFDEDFKPHNVVELMIDEKFLDGCIDTTNAQMTQTSCPKLVFWKKIKKGGHSLKAIWLLNGILFSSSIQINVGLGERIH